MKTNENIYWHNDGVNQTPTQHTPTPWTYYKNKFYGFGIYPADLNLEITIVGIRTKEDTVFIVRAVNAHDELVGALQLASEYILSNINNDIWDKEDDRMMETVKSALKKAGG